MSQELATMDDLPQDYRDALLEAGVAPLWPMMRNVLPHDAPAPLSRSHLWAYGSVRPLLMRAGELTPVEKAERRVLVLSDPGRGVGAMQATAAIYVGLQLLLPGETAPAHRHTPSAARIVVEGRGAYTVVDGEKLVMEEGDLILTPGGMWHDHGHEGSDPVVWLDALDLPLFHYLEASYAVEGALQPQKNRPDASDVEYLSAGLVPSRRRDEGGNAPRYPLMRFPWARVRPALDRMAAHAGREIAELDYVNPETGRSVLPTLGFTATLLPGGEAVRPPRRSSSAVFHVVEGNGASTINGVRHEWGPKDTFSAPVFAEIVHEAKETARVIRIHDTPLQEKLGFYEERD